MNERTLGDLIKAFVKRKPLNDRYISHQIGSVWKSALGATIHSYTEKIELRNGILTVRITSATLRHELSMGQDKLKRLLNSKLEAETIQEIRFQ